MSLAYIRNRYRVPARMGQRVLYTGSRNRPEGIEGTIVGADDARLLIHLDGRQRSCPFHPTWELTYLPMG